ncbi:MAG: DUF2610 domain-containing protein [Pseudomonadales bacterium]|nr:DUF2610 domain-containing protein [Pseudomonadales bacterium]
MSRSVTGELPIPVEEALEKLNKLAEKYNVEFTGDHSSGFAKGHGFHISYQIEGKNCTLTVSKKPLLVPWSMIEKQLAKLF